MLPWLSFCLKQITFPFLFFIPLLSSILPSIILTVLAKCSVLFPNKSQPITKIEMILKGSRNSAITLISSVCQVFIIVSRTLG